MKGHRAASDVRAETALAIGSVRQHSNNEWDVGRGRLEREKSLELSTSTLARLRSTN